VSSVISLFNLLSELHFTCTCDR